MKQEEEQQQRKQHSTECDNAMPNCAVCKRPVRMVSKANGPNSSNNNSNDDFGAEHICAGCVAFFKHCIAKQRLIIHCNRHSQCRQAEELMSCPSCRLDRCLLAGMCLNANANVPWQQQHQHSIQGTRQWIERRRALLMRGETMVASGSVMQQDRKPCVRSLIQSESGPEHILAPLYLSERQYRRIYESSTDLDLMPFYSQTLDDLLSSKENLLSKAEQFSDIPHAPLTHKDLMAFKRGTCNLPGRVNSTCKAPNCEPMYLDIHLLLNVELAKTLPAFQSLRLADKVALVSHVAFLSMNFAIAFYSVQNGYDTYTCPNQAKPVWIGDDRYNLGKNQVARLAPLREQIFRSEYQNFVNISLFEEEFLLLRALLFSHITTPNLTAEGQRLVLKSAEMYSKALLQLCQQRHGAIDGARRYSEVIMFTEFLFRTTHKHRQYITSMGMLSEQCADCMANMHQYMDCYAGQCIRGSTEMPKIEAI